MKLVIVESPYAGNIERNVAYARAAMADCLRRGEAPLASHLLYTQPGILDDSIPEQRTLGIEAGLLWGAKAGLTAIYTDLGFSNGMCIGKERAIAAGREVVAREVPIAALSLVLWPFMHGTGFPLALRHRMLEYAARQLRW
ncbi:MAG: hypothetical protein WAV09_03110 [Minisyncoccia bacterium]